VYWLSGERWPTWSPAYRTFATLSARTMKRKKTEVEERRKRDPDYR